MKNDIEKMNNVQQKNPSKKAKYKFLKEMQAHLKQTRINQKSCKLDKFENITDKLSLYNANSKKDWSM